MESLTVLYPDNQPLKGTIRLPASKSISNRLLIIKTLSKATTAIHGLSDCTDTQVLQNALQSTENELNVQHSGTAFRFLTAFLSLQKGRRLLTGSPQLQQRPVAPVVEALRTLGANIRYAGRPGFPPLEITGTQLQSRHITIDAGVSSQFISALLMIAPLLPNGLVLRLQGHIVSKPYIFLTTSLMQQFGAVVHYQDSTFRVEKGYHHAPVSATVEADWSAASYWFATTALVPGTELVLNGLQPNSLQGDARLRTWFKYLGAVSEFSDNGLIVKNQSIKIKQFQADFIETPDLLQTFATVLPLLNVPFVIEGLNNLRIKETDRISALQKEMLKTGFVLHAQGNQLAWRNETTRTAAPCPTIETYNDHRMAMAFAPMACKIKRVEIKNPGVVEKSYPGFWKDMKSVGFIIE